MVREQGTFKLTNPWSRIAWGLLAAVCIVSCLVGFLVLGRSQQNGPTLDTWAAFCRALGLTADVQPAREPQPPRRTPTRIAWTSETLARVASGNKQHGAAVAGICGACHGAQGVSALSMFPTLAGMDAAAIYKQLDDYRSGKRVSPVMTGMAATLKPQDVADVAAYFGSRPGGLRPVSGEGAPESGRSLRQRDPIIRLIFAGDPERGIPPCSACHGPDAQKLGAPPLRGQHPEYIEAQLAAFAQGSRQNDINEQMRVIAHELTPVETRGVAAYYGAAGDRE
jgi:cytochrome c553